MDIKKFWNKWGYLCIFVFLILVLTYFYIFNKKDLLKPEKETTKYYPRLNTKDYNKLFEKKKKESKGELECKRVMEKIYGVPFIKIRPKWMMNPETGKNLELDVYNPSLKIAVEYNGSQHLHYNPYFHRSMEDFEKQKARDQFKRLKCKEYNILLIEVPYTIDNDKIEKFIVDELKKNGKI